MPEDKFEEYRRQTSSEPQKTWAGWVIAFFLLAAAAFSWSYAAPVYFSQDSEKNVDVKDSNKKSKAGKKSSKAWVPDKRFGFGRKRPGELAVIFFDIGQGDAALIHTPFGKTVLIDAGEGRHPDSRYHRQIDAANTVILPYLKLMNIKHLDVVVASHPHSDHMGGMADVIGSKWLTTGEMWVSGFVNPTKSNKRLLITAKNRSIPVKVPEQDKLPIKIDLGTDVSLWIIYANEEPGGESPINNSSIIMKLVYGKVGVLFTGDGQEESEKEQVLMWGRSLKATVLKVGHHGSKSSSTSQYLDYVRPRVAVISCGAYNTFGHPRPEVLQRFNDRNTKIYRTDINGHVALFTNGLKYRIVKSHG